MPKKTLRRLLPTPHRVVEHRFLTWLKPWLQNPRLWHVSRDGIALGAAIGLFFGLMIPVGQFAAAAAVALVLRANLPMSVVCTLVTNPFTFAPIYFIAHRLGAWLLNGGTAVATDSFAPEALNPASGLGAWLDRILALGGPLFLGLFVLACSAALLSYLSIRWLWNLSTWREWRSRHDRRRALGEQA